MRIDVRDHFTIHGDPALLASVLPGRTATIRIGHLHVHSVANGVREALPDQLAYLRPSHIVRVYVAVCVISATRSARRTRGSPGVPPAAASDTGTNGSRTARRSVHDGPDPA